MRPNNEPMWTSPRRIYLNAEGQVVEEGDASKVSLLAAKGGMIPQAQAVSLGLIEVTEPTVKEVKPAATKAEAPVEDKAVKPAANKTK